MRLWLAAVLLGLCASVQANTADEPLLKTLGFYWQAASGHLNMLANAKPVDELLADPATDARLKARLEKAKGIRAYASTALKLPNNASYTRYSDLRQPAVVWNVVASPPYALQAKTWCFAVAGCVGYRGYHNQAEAMAEGELLKAQGYEISVYPVPAYSTLGKLNMLGGDPLLNTFINYPDAELARLIFHELAHQVLYVGDDTVFNESFATAVERIGARLWMAQHASPEVAATFEARNQRARQWRELLARTRGRLQDLFLTTKNTYLKPNSPVVYDSIEFVAINSEVIAEKARIMQTLRDEYQTLKKSWGGDAAYDQLLARTNNATLVATGAYDELVPQFEAVFERMGAERTISERQGRDFERFYAAIRSITHLPKLQRRAALQTMAQSP